MSNKKLIAIDMDGTLLNDKKEICPLTKGYLKELTKQGHKIVLASGRPTRALLSYYKELELDTPLICYNGAHVYSFKDPNFEEHCFEFPCETIHKIYNELKEISVNTMCETETEIWIDKEDQFLFNFFWLDGMKINIGPIDEILNKNPMTFIVQIKEDNLETVNFVNKVIAKYLGIEARFWGMTPYFELFFTETSKANSIKQIASYYGICDDDIIAFGDAYNDLEMFKSVKNSVAMLNATGELKKYAKYISPKDNNNDGIYYALKDFNLI